MGEPNETLYLNNLNSRVSKRDMKRTLYSLFALYGTVLQIHTKSTAKGRGQAFIVFNDVPHAVLSMKALQGFLLFEKPIKIHYAKTKSTVIKALLGTLYNKNLNKRGLDYNGDADQTKRVKLDVAEQETNQVLFVTNLPKNINAQALTTLFAQYDGFSEVRSKLGLTVSNPWKE